jgi:hypothetical protein
MACLGALAVIQVLRDLPQALLLGGLLSNTPDLCTL